MPKQHFFIVGLAAVENPALVQRILAEGHTIGNHSWDHTPLTQLSLKKQIQQIFKWESSVGVQKLKLFRPPYGIQNVVTALVAKVFGYTIVAASVVADDWKQFDIEVILNRLLKDIKSGDIVLMHDRLFKTSDQSVIDRTSMLTLLEKLFEQMAGDYDFLSVEELMSRGEPEYSPWTHQPAKNILSPSHINS